MMEVMETDLMLMASMWSLRSPAHIHTRTRTVRRVDPLFCEVRRTWHEDPGGRGCRRQENHWYKPGWGGAEEGKEGSGRWHEVGRSLGGREGSYHMGRCEQGEGRKVLETSQLMWHTPRPPHEALSKDVCDWHSWCRFWWWGTWIWGIWNRILSESKDGPPSQYLYTFCFKWSKHCKQALHKKQSSPFHCSLNFSLQKWPVLKVKCVSFWYFPINTQTQMQCLKMNSGFLLFFFFWEIWYHSFPGTKSQERLPEYSSINVASSNYSNSHRKVCLLSPLPHPNCSSAHSTSACRSLQRNGYSSRSLQARLYHAPILASSH